MRKILSLLFILLINNAHAQITNDYPTVKLNNDIELIVGNHSTVNIYQPPMPDKYDIRLQSKDSIVLLGLYYNSFQIIKEKDWVAVYENGIYQYRFTISSVQVFRSSDHERGGSDMKYVLNKKKRTKTKGELVLRYKVKNMVREISIPLKKILHQTLSNTPVPRLIDQH